MLRVASVLATLVALGSFTAGVAASEEPPVLLALVTSHPPVVQTTAARALFDDVNQTRVQHGLKPLTDDPRLDKVARDVAAQMARRHYFGHTDPDGVTFEQRLVAEGCAFRFAAENMAFDRDVAHANAALLHSPGHYANIVDPAPRKLGTAVVDAGDGQVFFVEEFAD